jgi:Trehalose utilisation
LFERLNRLVNSKWIAGVLLVSAAAGSAWAQGGRGGVPQPPGQNPNGMHIYLWAGLKSHGPGQHDYPQFLADWSKLLTEHGAVVEGALHEPSVAELSRADVVVIYKGDAVFMSPEERAALEAYVKRGGGLVTFHDSLCGPDPAWFATLVGGAKKHGETNFTLDAPIPYTVVDKTNPIMADMTDMTLWDEAFFLMTWSADPKVHVLVNAVIAPTRSARDCAADVDLRAYDGGRAAGSGFRLDAGPHVCEFFELSDSADSAARDCMGGEEAGERAGGLRGSAASGWTGWRRWACNRGSGSGQRTVKPGLVRAGGSVCLTCPLVGGRGFLLFNL